MKAYNMKFYFKYNIYLINIKKREEIPARSRPGARSDGPQSRHPLQHVHEDRERHDTQSLNPKRSQYCRSSGDFFRRAGW